MLTCALHDQLQAHVQREDILTDFFVAYHSRSTQLLETNAVHFCSATVHRRSTPTKKGRDFKLLQLWNKNKYGDVDACGVIVNSLSVSTTQVARVSQL
jgi:hypothetical protein